MSEETIRIDEEEVAGEGTAEKGREWTEEFKVAGQEIISTVEDLIQQATVRKIIVKRGDKELVEIPLVFGVAGLSAGIVMAPFYAALALAGALALDCSILVVRSEKKPEAEGVEPAVAAE
jgi:hypothetical protein